MADKSRAEILQEWADLMVGPLEKFCPAFVRVPSKSGPITPLYLNPAQRELHRRIERQKARTGKVRVLIPKARQMGVSAYILARGFRKTITEPGVRTFILTHEDDATTELFGRVRTMYEQAPEPEALPKAANNSAQSLVFNAIQSGYRVGTARTKAKGRSQTIQFFHGSEVAYWPAAGEHMSGVMQAVSDEGNTEIILESTGAGPRGLFYQLCREAQRGEGAGAEYEIVFLPWFLDPSYREEAPADWQATAEWEEYADLHGLDRDQMYWAYKKNAQLAAEEGLGPDEPCWRFKREYPATLEEAFIEESSDSLIPAERVLAARKTTIEDTGESYAGHVLGVDVGSDGGDQTFMIDRHGRRMGKTIFEGLNRWTEMQVAGKVAEYIERYRFDRVFIDCTGGYGRGVVDRLHELGYSGVVTGINFGAAAINDQRFANRRVEMYWRMLDWLSAEGGADIPDSDVLHAHLTAPRRRPDSNGRVVLERKSEIRKPERLGFSPDAADAAALTFAENVVKPGAHEDPAVRRSRELKRKTRQSAGFMAR